MVIPLKITAEQSDTFNKLLIDGTANTLIALETVFELSIDSSDSSIEVAPTVQNENLKHFGVGPLYVISSALTGDLNGSIVLVLRAADFNYLSELMRPVLSLLYLASSDIDLNVQDRDKPEWMTNEGAGQVDDLAYREHMMDALAEMGNVLIGLYIRSIFKICGLNSRHSVPLVMKDPHQTTIRRILYSSEERERLHLVIENELFLEDKPLKLWCLISPARDSFRDMLDGIDGNIEQPVSGQQRSVNWA